MDTFCTAEKNSFVITTNQNLDNFKRTILLEITNKLLWDVFYPNGNLVINNENKKCKGDYLTDCILGVKMI